jgi:integrase
VSRRAAAAARRQLVESVERRETLVCREDFASFWDRFVGDKQPYVTAGSHLDLVTHGRKRLLPFFGADQLSSIDPERVREWLTTMVELIEAGEVSPKTANNARTYLSMAFEEAARRGLIVRNPCASVRALPVDRPEVEFLRLAEIDAYLDACSPAYRPLAEFLIGTGARVSEAVATRWADVDLEEVSRGSTASASETRATPDRPRASDSVRSRWARASARRCGNSG